MSNAGGLPVRPAIASAAPPTQIDGRLAHLSTDTAGNVRASIEASVTIPVNIVGGGGSGGTSAVDETAFTVAASAGTPMMGAVTPGDSPPSGDLAIVALDANRNLKVNIVAGGSGGGAVTVANGADVTEGAIADAAVVGDVNGTISAKLRGLNKIWNSVWSSANSWLQVSIQNATIAVTQSGSWVLSAGTALIGKVGIDQTTPGTTNGVQTLSGSTTVVTGTVTVSGTVTANAGANLNTSTLALETGGNLAAVSAVAGVTSGAAVITDVNGTLQQYLRGIVKLIATNITVVIAAGSALIGKVGIDQTTPGTTNLVAAGGVGAAAASLTGNPMRNGGLGRTTTPTAVSSAQLVDLLLDRLGRTFVVSPVTSRAASAATPITTNTNTTIVAAPSAGNHLRIHRLWAQNSGAVATWCYWGNGSGDKTGPPFYLATGQPFSMAMEGRWELSSATGLFLTTATTGANIEWYAEYETLAD